MYTEDNMTMNIKIMWGIGALAVVAAGVGAYLLFGNAANKNSETNAIAVQSVARIFQGTVTSVSKENMQISVTGIAGSTDPFEKTVMISPATKIEKVLSQKNSKGDVEKQLLIEVNMSDLVKGDKVTVAYATEEFSVLSGVSSVLVAVDGNVDAYVNQAPQSEMTVYLKVDVVSIDTAGKKLVYHPYIFGKIGEMTISVAIPDEINVYRVDDPMRVSITHARTTATLADIQPGETIFVMANKNSLQAGRVVPLAFIISGK